MHLHRRAALAAVVAAVLVVAMTPSVAAAPIAPAAPTAPGVTVRGTVLDAGGAPVPGITVTLSSDSATVNVLSASDGSYATAPLPDGDYTVSFTDSDGSAPHLPTQYWPKVWTSSQASPLELSAGVATEVTGIDAVLQLGASVAGTITDGEGGPIDGACANAWMESGEEYLWLGNTMADPTGAFLLSPLAPVDVVVEYVDCTPPATWAPRYHGQSASPQAATTLGLTPGAALTNIDGQLVPAASISGTVRDEAGAPLEGFCATDVREGIDGPEWDQTDITGPDGTYELTPLDEGEHWVYVQPCDEAPYLPASAGPVVLGVGEHVSGVDVSVARAATVSGTVRTTGGDPVEGICVQAADDGHVAGSATTDADGRYVLLLERSGALRVQFVDCNDPARLGGATTQVEVVVGEDVTGVDAVLSPAEPASISGTVTNVRGEPLADVCVAAYLAYDHVRFTRTGSDGTYRIADLGPGAWSIAYLSCGEDDGPDVSPVVPDVSTGVAWNPLWWGGATLELSEDDGPDPIAQGAELVDLDAGTDSLHDMCFGCDAITADIQLDRGAVRAEFVAHGLAPDGAEVSAAAAGPTYSLVCSPEGDATAAAMLVTSGSEGPLTVDGVDPDVIHSCSVVAEVAGLVVARSAMVEVGSVAVVTATPSDGTAAGAGDSEPLAFVG